MDISQVNWYDVTEACILILAGLCGLGACCFAFSGDKRYEKWLKKKKKKMNL